MRIFAGYVGVKRGGCWVSQEHCGCGCAHLSAELCALHLPAPPLFFTSFSPLQPPSAEGFFHLLLVLGESEELLSSRIQAKGSNLKPLVAWSWGHDSHIFVNPASWSCAIGWPWIHVEFGILRYQDTGLPPLPDVVSHPGCREEVIKG